VHRVASSAILFLYREVLQTNLPWRDEIGRPQTKRRLPVVLSTAEVRRLLDSVDADHDTPRACSTAPGCGSWRRCG
jgi:site-specific recombinase XerD